MAKTLVKDNIVKDNSNFQKIYREGKSFADANVVLHICKVFHPNYRVAFAAGKKLGNAVVRNRVKRLLREAYRLHRESISEEYCLLLVGRKAAVEAKMQDVEKSFLKLCKKANILKQSEIK